MYNTILRRFPAKEYEAFRAGGNLFSTTIFVLVSAVTKIARVMRLPPGLELFRGLGGRTQLPESFLLDDEHGCKGYMEWGFLSTTACRETAIEYSGVGDGKPLPMVIQTKTTSIDRGACIKEFSQYPGEVHTAFQLTFHRTLISLHQGPILLKTVHCHSLHILPGRVPLAAWLISGTKWTFVSGGGLWIVPDDAACPH